MRWYMAIFWFGVAMVLINPPARIKTECLIVVERNWRDQIVNIGVADQATEEVCSAAVKRAVYEICLNDSCVLEPGEQ